MTDKRKQDLEDSIKLDARSYFKGTPSENELEHFALAFFNKGREYEALEINEAILVMQEIKPTITKLGYKNKYLKKLLENEDI